MIEIMAIAGNGGNAARWARLPQPLADDVVLTPIVLPGFDGKPMPAASPTVDDFAAWLIDEIQAQRSHEHVIVLGTGIGGSIAFQAAQHAGLVDGYIFHAPVGPSLDTRLLPKIMKPSIMRRGVKAAIGGPVGRVALRRRFGNVMTRHEVDAFAQGYLDCDAFEVMWDILTPGWFDALQPVSDPAVLIWGADDGVLDADHAGGFDAVLPDATVMVESSWAHYPMLESPGAFAATIAEIARSLVARVSPSSTIHPLGSGTFAVRGISGKAARLDDARVAGLAVPTSSLVPDGADARQAGEALAERHRGPTAVRSAFAAEDRDDQSLAGHFDSVLNVEPTPAALARAIEAVRASGSDDFRRDVLIMDMVPAQIAGVAFSEPGWLDDVVNYTDGLGEALLAGKEEGHRLALDRRRRNEDDAPWQGRLAALLEQCRTHYGDLPWDIEFADDGTMCWLLQIRPITRSPVRNEWFTLANHREILPDPPSVFMTSLIEEASAALSGPLGILDGSAEGRRFIEVFDRRPYLNLSLLTDFLRNLGLPTSLVADSLGGSDGRSVPADPMQLIRQTPKLARIGLRQFTAARTARLVSRQLATVGGSTGTWFGPIIDSAGESYVALVDQMASLATAMAVPVSLVGKAGSLDYHLRKQRTAATRMLDDIYELATLASGDAGAQALLARGEVPADPAFVTRWATWLDAHGQRGQFESDLARPRYHEDPRPVLQTVGRIAASERVERSSGTSLTATLTTPLWLIAKGPMAARESLRTDAMRALISTASTCFDAQTQPLLPVQSLPRTASGC